MASDFSQDVLAHGKSWPFEEARGLIARLDKMDGGALPDKTVVFETGYGPSGLPHIGTFGEVVRTSMVRHAFETLTGRRAKLICFSDDMDGLRKVPDNIPNQAAMATHLGKALTDVPDPFGTHASFGAHNNARLQGFLDGFGFDYDFYSSTECYQSGRFDAALLNVLANYDRIMGVVVPTLGDERGKTYSPFMPVCPDTRQVLQAEVLERDVNKGAITYKHPSDGRIIETPVTGGKCKLQWKCDWAMRWYALGVDYEMAGKDLSESVKLSSRINRQIGGTPPVGISYELFLDQNGEKISKSKGNGLSIDEWLTYGTPEALSLFMYNQPRRAKRLFFDVVPKMVDDYFSHLGKYAGLEAAAKIDSPLWHIHSGVIPEAKMPVSFSLLLNLASVCQAEKADVIWGYLEQYDSGISPSSNAKLAELVDYAVAYYRDRIQPFKTYRQPTEGEIIALQNLDARLGEMPDDASGEEIQSAVFAVGKDAAYDPLRDWFRVLYQTLLGQDEGPRMGSFIKLYGTAKTRALIADACSGKLTAGFGDGDK